MYTCIERMSFPVPVSINIYTSTCIVSYIVKVVGSITGLFHRGAMDIDKLFNISKKLGKARVGVI